MDSSQGLGSAPDRGPRLMGLMWTTTGISTIAVVLRLIVRFQRAIIGWDDVFMVVAMLCFYGWTICLTSLCINGGERHIRDVVALGPDIVARVQLLNWTAQVFGIFGVAAGKVSISALLLAILRNTRRKWQSTYLWIFCIVLAVAIATACSILTFAQCRPAAALWDERITGECLNPKIMADFGTFTGAYNTFVDASLALIPSTVFWTLQMDFDRKVQLSMVFALNVLTSICSGIKTSYLSQLGNREDFTWATYDIFAWVTAEFFLIIVCGTIPTLKPIANFIRGRGWTSRKLSSYQLHTGANGFSRSDDAIQLHGHSPNMDGTSSYSASHQDDGKIGNEHR